MSKLGRMGEGEKVQIGSRFSSKARWDYTKHFNISTNTESSRSTQ